VLNITAMNDLFLPFQKSFLGDSQEVRTDGDSRSKILEKIEDLKQSLHHESDHQKLVKLTEQIQKAVSQLKSFSETKTLKDDQALNFKNLIFAYGAGGKDTYFEKLTTYFSSVEDLLQAPVSLLKAHGLSGDLTQKFKSYQSRKEIVAKTKRVIDFMTEHHWNAIAAKDLPETGKPQSSRNEVLPALYFVRGDATLLRKTKIAMMGDKLEMPTTYHDKLPSLIDNMKAMNIVPICNLLQQSSLQFALNSVRRGLPSIIALGMDIMRAFEKNYRFLNYFVDQGCLLMSTHMPLLETRHNSLQLFKVKMALSKVIILFIKYLDAYEMSDYSSKYWPVLNHCHQQDKLCLLYHPSDNRQISQVLQHWQTEESHLVLYNSLHELKLLLKALELKGHLNQALVRDTLGALSNVTVLH
jgi:hypothetical protein